MAFITNHLTLGKKFTLGFGTLIAMTVVLAITVSIQVISLNKQIETVLEKDVKSVLHATAMQGDIHGSLGENRQAYRRITKVIHLLEGSRHD